MIIRLRRGTTAEAVAHVGLDGSVFIDSELKLLYLHDGVTVGGTLVGGVSEARVQQLIETYLDTFTVAVADVTGLTAALADTVKVAELGTTVATLDEGKIPVVQIPVIETVSPEQIQAIATEFGFTKDGEGKWVLDSNPTP